LLEAKGIEVIGRSLIDCTAMPFTQVVEADWVFFYSRNGVRFFLEGLGEPLSAKIRLATMGNGTAQSLKAYGYPVHFIGTGKPSSTASAFNEIANHQGVVFPRAKVSKKSIQQLLLPTIQQIDLVVYNNQAKKDFDLPDCRYLVFTSPLNVQAYFSRKNYQNGQLIVAIGTTTEEKLQELGFFNIIVARRASEQALATAILEQLL